tara:strand:+ start:112 stop:675 length:564 start_codon:yes stop_codon:yes gene_type:complete
MIQQATIHKLPLLVGCKAFERNQNGQMLIDIISRFVEAEFKGVDDFKLVTAFQKAASGTLNLNNKPLALSTYGQQLSPKVVGEVLRAWIQTERSIAAAPKFQQHQLPEAPINQIDAKFMYDWTINHIQEHGKLPEFPMYGLLYEYLLERKEVKAIPDEKPTGRFALFDEENKYERTVRQWFMKQGFV